jgi:hypothetical protein
MAHHQEALLAEEGRRSQVSPTRDSDAHGLDDHYGCGHSRDCSKGDRRRK